MVFVTKKKSDYEPDRKLELRALKMWLVEGGKTKRGILSVEENGNTNDECLRASSLTHITPV